MPRELLRRPVGLPPALLAGARLRLASPRGAEPDALLHGPLGALNTFKLTHGQASRAESRSGIVTHALLLQPEPRALSGIHLFWASLGSAALGAAGPRGAGRTSAFQGPLTGINLLCCARLCCAGPGQPSLGPAGQRGVGRAIPRALSGIHLFSSRSAAARRCPALSGARQASPAQRVPSQGPFGAQQTSRRRGAMNRVPTLGFAAPCTARRSSAFHGPSRALDSSSLCGVMLGVLRQSDAGLRDAHLAELVRSKGPHGHKTSRRPATCRMVMLPESTRAFVSRGPASRANASRSKGPIGHDA